MSFAFNIEDTYKIKMKEDAGMTFQVTSLGRVVAKDHKHCDGCDNS